MNYEKDVRINEDELDVEWLEQPSLMMKYTKNSAQAQRDLDSSKEKFEFVKAELDKKIRNDPKAFDVEKITDKVVENTIYLQEEYKEASQEYIQAKFEFNTAKGAVEAISQRKEALENLGRLLSLQYFSGPSMPRDIHKEREEKQRRANAAVASARRTK